jgi:hypothetical protein
MYKTTIALLGLATTSLLANTSINLLDNGLERFEIWMGIPHTTVTGLPDDTFQADDVTKGEPMGLDADVKDVFTIIHEEGVPILKITGEIYGGLTTLDSFENYRFSTLFKWGETKWEPRLNKKRDSGILYHCHGEHGRFWNVWMRSLEYQVQEADLGDFIGLWGPKGLIRVTQSGDKYKYDPTSDEALMLSDYTFASLEPQKPNGEWNLLELYTIGQTAIHVVNGVVVMVLQETQDGGGAPLTKGQIQIQSEAAECYYKEMLITPISEFPESVTSQIPFDL